MRRSIQEIKSALVDPRSVVTALHLDTGMRPQTNGVMIRCPVHDDARPSCSVQTVGDRILWYCHGCDEHGDVFALIAAAYDLDRQRDFREIFEIASAIANDATRTSALTASGPRAAPPPPTYPPADEVTAMLRDADPVETDSQASAWCRSRQLDAARIDDCDLAAVLRRSGRTPAWAACGRPWSETHHRLIVPTFDASGVMRSVRARAIGPASDLKELSPKGHTTRGLVLANDAARRMLRGSFAPRAVVITEGTPDFLTRATLSFREAVLGIIGGVGLPADVAAKIPDGTRVAVRVDQDDAGHRYEAGILAALANRCTVCVFGESAP